MWPGWPGQKPGYNLLTFIFLLKRRRFDLKKKNWPRQPGDPVKTRTLDRAGSENYGLKCWETL
jgi:hypothetical protein